jgi:hypothetical protein
MPAMTRMTARSQSRTYIRVDLLVLGVRRVGVLLPVEQARYHG